MNARRLVIDVAAIAMLLSLASPLSAQQTASPRGALTDADRNFVLKATAEGRDEVELGQLGQEKAASDAVKQFARRMVEDHGKATRELTDLAAGKGVQLKESARSHAAMRAKLGKLSGADFDREYVKAMMKDHRKDVAEFRRMSEKAADPDLKAWVAKTLPTLQDHLRTIESLERQVAPGSK